METKNEIRVILARVRDNELGEKEAIGRIISALVPDLGDIYFVIDLVQNKVISPEEGVDDILHRLN